jgi:hypothetical protein
MLDLRISKQIQNHQTNQIISEVQFKKIYKKILF